MMKETNHKTGDGLLLPNSFSGYHFAKQDAAAKQQRMSRNT